MVISVNKKIVEEDDGHTHDADSRFYDMCNTFDRLLASANYDKEKLEILKAVIEDYIAAAAASPT